MKIFSRPVFFLVVILIFGAGLGGVVCGQDQPGLWMEYTQARANLISFYTGDEENVLEGCFSLHYPHSFSFCYQASDVWRKISSYDNLVQILAAGRGEYSTNDFWLFRLYRDYIYALADFSELPLDFVMQEQIGPRIVDRYTDRENPDHTYWFDRLTALPLLVQHGDKTVVAATDSFQKQTNQLELDVFFSQQWAKITLLYTGEYWVPRRLEIEGLGGQRVLEFDDWQVGEDEIGNAADLKRMNSLIAQSDLAVDAEHWEAVIAANKGAIAIDSQYWQGYFFMGFAYSKLDNYLGTVENYQQALMLVPEQPVIMNNLAYTYFVQEVQIALGLELARQAVEYERRPTYLDTLGYGYYLVGRYEEAKELMEEALAAAAPEERSEIEKHLLLVRQILAEEQDH